MTEEYMPEEERLQIFMKKQKQAQAILAKLPMDLVMDQWNQLCDANPQELAKGLRSRIYRNDRKVLDQVFAGATPSQMADLMITDKYQYNPFHHYFAGHWSGVDQLHYFDYLYSFNTIDDGVAMMINCIFLLDWIREHLDPERKDRYGL